MLAPWTYSYLIEITGRPMHLFRLSYTSWLSLKSGSPARLYQRDSSSRCHQDEPGCSEKVAVTHNLSVSGKADEHSLFALQSCVFGCEGNVADVRKTV